MWGIIFRGLLTLLRSLGARGGAAGARTTVAVSRFGRVAFTGLIRNRPLSQLTHQEVRNAMAFRFLAIALRIAIFLQQANPRSHKLAVIVVGPTAD